MAPRPPVVVKIRTKVEDQERASAHRTPDLPFDKGWQPPALQGVAGLTVKGNTLVSILGPRLTTATLTQTLDEPLSIVLVVWDHDRALLASGLLDTKMTVQLGSQKFSMTRVAKAGDAITLEFEDAAVNAFRQLKKPIKATRGTSSRIEFVQRLLNEAGAPRLVQYVDAGTAGQITVQKNPLALVAHKARKPGPFMTSKVRHVQATAEQLDNLRVVLGHMYDQGATRDELIMTVMCVTAESSWVNNPGGSGSSVGLFQQTPEGGYNFDRRNRILATDAWFSRLKQHEANVAGQNVAKYIIIQSVQGSGAGKATAGKANYGPWEEEATKTVSAWNGAYGGSQSAVALKQYEFRRGNIDGTPETSWECLGRLADEVQYRRFIVEDVFYFLPDELLVATGPRLFLTERSAGMLTPIDFDFDEGYDPQSATFSIRTGDWSSPVGTCVELDDMGPANGVWLVNKITADLFVPHQLDIELVRPQAVLTEPPDDETLDPSEYQGGGRDQSGVLTTPDLADTTNVLTGDFSGTPKGIIDNIAIPVAAANGVTKTPAQNDIDNANHTHLGNASDHAGPPDYKWAADFGIGPDIRGGTNETGAANGDRVAAALAKKFNIPWNGQGVANATHDGYRFQLLWRYESAQAGNHYTHVHFGVRRAS